MIRILTPQSATLTNEILVSVDHNSIKILFINIVDYSTDDKILTDIDNANSMSGMIIMSAHEMSPNLINSTLFYSLQLLETST